MPLPALRLWALAAAIAMIVALAGATAAGAQAPRACASADLRYPFEKGGPKTFGVHKLRIVNGDCATARTVARRWMKRFEAHLADGRVKLPKHVLDYTFKPLRPRAAQTYRLRGIRAATTIRFNYVVPNG